jgi:hypothetical protein
VLVINGALSHRVLGESVDRDGLAIKVILMTLCISFVLLCTRFVRRRAVL